MPRDFNRALEAILARALPEFRALQSCRQLTAGASQEEEDEEEEFSTDAEEEWRQRFNDVVERVHARKIQVFYRKWQQTAHDKKMLRHEKEEEAAPSPTKEL